jgi:hypothetical protein
MALPFHARLDREDQERGSKTATNRLSRYLARKALSVSRTAVGWCAKSSITTTPRCSPRISARRFTFLKLESAPAKLESTTRGRFDSVFLRRMNAAPEWADLELLLRALAEVHARPLLLSMPMDGRFYDRQGYSRLARENYYEKMRALAQRYDFELIEFEDHDEDPTFLDAQHTHLTQEGWLFYDRALDDFFHGRVPRS